MTKHTSLICPLMIGIALFCCLAPAACTVERPPQVDPVEDPFPEANLITREELDLAFTHGSGAQRLAFSSFPGSREEWREEVKNKLAELLGLQPVSPGEVIHLRHWEHQGVIIHALVMRIGGSLTLPAYWLVPREEDPGKSAVLAIHGHGQVEPAIGWRDDYHHSFALELAKDGHRVLCPELRGFGALSDLAHDREIDRLDYWIGGYSQFTLVTDGFLHGRTLIGETVEDLLRWEEWLARTHGVERIDTAGISYGGDLCLVYPAFSARVGRIFASGTMGSFSVIFRRCYNAPAHCIPGILEWMDRSDIAGLNAPRPIVVHFGELDTPGPSNASASYNETVPRSMDELRRIYAAFGAEDAVQLMVTPGSHHEMDIPALLSFLR